MAERKLAFYQIRGLATEAQLAFERIQDAVQRNMTPAKMTIEISITPPDDEERRFGRISFKVGTKESPIESKSFHTLFKNGKIIADGVDDAEAAQLDLELPEEPKIVSFQKEA